MKLAQLILAATLLLLPFNVLAQDQNGSARLRRQAAQEFRQQLIEDRQQELTEARAQRIVDRCERLGDRIEQIAGRLQTLRGARGNLILSLTERLENFSARLQAADLDTTGLDEDIATLKTLSDELNTLWTTHGDKIEALKSADCSEGAQSFHEALEAAKIAMADVRAKFKEIKDFLISDIKPELQQLRSQLTEEDDSETNDGDEQ